jgi:hypothetical protein
MMKPILAIYPVNAPMIHEERKEQQEEVVEKKIHKEYVEMLLTQQLTENDEKVEEYREKQNNRDKKLIDFNDDLQEENYKFRNSVAVGKEEFYKNLFGDDQYEHLLAKSS